MGALRIKVEEAQQRVSALLCHDVEPLGLFEITRRTMKLLPVLLIFSFGVIARTQSVSNEEPFFEGSKQGQNYSSFLIEAKSLNKGLWKIKTKTIFNPDRGVVPYYSESVVDCNRQTITNKEGFELYVPIRWSNSAEIGAPELYEAVCEKKPE